MASRPIGAAGGSTPIMSSAGVGTGAGTGIGTGTGTGVGGGAGVALTTSTAATTGAAVTGVAGATGTAATAPGTAATTAAAAAASKNTSRSALQEIEESYNKRLDQDITQLMESFGDIVKVASITYNESSISKDKYKLAQESYQIQGRATNIVTSAESLLAMVTELKQTLLLNDTSTLAELSTRRQKELSTQKTAVKQRIVGLKDEVDRTIWELEQACYGSMPPSTFSSSSSSHQHPHPHPRSDSHSHVQTDTTTDTITDTHTHAHAHTQSQSHTDSQAQQS